MSIRAKALWRLPGEKECYQIEGLARAWTGEHDAGFVVAPFYGEALIVTGNTTCFQCRNNATKGFLAGAYSEQKEVYINSVQALLKQMQDDIFLKKTVLSRTRVFSCHDFNPSQAFDVLCEVYPHAAISLVDLDGVCWLAASPELLLRTHGTQLHTMSLAGTRAQSAQTPFLDKEFEEQKIVTDQICAVLHRTLCNSIETEGPYIREAGNLKHLCTDIEANYVGKLDVLLRELHPTPAVGGVPKERSIELIEQLEPFDRELYGGYWGMLQTHSSNFYVHIRCLKFDRGECTLYAGAGITASSDPESEWLETEHKLNTLFGVLFA